MKLIVKLSDILKERDMTQARLAELTGIRKAAISEIVNNQRQTINRAHLERIADALGIEDVSELLTLADRE